MSEIFLLDTALIPPKYTRAIEIGRSVGISQSKLEEYAIDTMQFIRYKKIELGIGTWDRMQRYYNSYVNGLTSDKEVNAFLWHSKLEPIAIMFRVFVTRSVSREGHEHYKFNFGVLNSHYDYFKNNGKAPNYFAGGGNKKQFNDPGEYKRVRFRMRDVAVSKTPLMEHFLERIALLNKLYPDDKVAISEVVTMAIEEYMENHEEIFGEVEIELDESKIRERNPKKTAVLISGETGEKAHKAVQRYNYLNPARPIVMEDFMEAAVKAHLERIPIEYTNPEVAERLAKIKKQTDEEKT